MWKPPQLERSWGATSRAFACASCPVKKMWPGRKNLRMLRGWGSIQGPKRQTKVHLINLIPWDPGWSWYWAFSDTPSFNVDLKWLKHPRSRQQKLKTLRNPKLLWPIFSPAFTSQISPFWGFCNHHVSTKRSWEKMPGPSKMEVSEKMAAPNHWSFPIDYNRLSPVCWMTFPTWLRKAPYFDLDGKRWAWIPKVASQNSPAATSLAT